MNLLLLFAGVLVLLGSALVGGVFFAFSSFVMKALERVPSPEGIAAMQSINVVVVNPSFLGAFIGTAGLSLGVAGLAVLSWGHPSSAYFLAGSICYVAGTFLVTIVGNIPLNDQLAAVCVSEPAAVDIWKCYLDEWTMWNHIRTFAAMVAALLYTLALMQDRTI